MGGGVPFESELYDLGEFPGSNDFRDLARRYRDLKIRERDQQSNV